VICWRTLAVIAALPAMALANCGVIDVLQDIRPGAQWSMTGTSYSSLNWIDETQTKPTLAEVQAAQSACQTALTPSGLLAKQRATAISEFQSATDAGVKRDRAIMLILLDELNILRQRDRDRSADVAAATSLADLKTRWAGRSSLTDRTVDQAKTAFQAKIDSGAAD